MLANEEEAQTKHCCGPEGCGEFHGGYRWCIASKCMAWRWVSEGYLTPADEERIKAGLPLGAVYTKRERGLCGLGGRDYC